MHNILLQIIEKKKIDLQQQKRAVPFHNLHLTNASKKQRNFLKAMKQKATGINLIAEIKLASPTIVSLGSESEILERARQYEQAGADAISFITEKHFFKGDIRFIQELKQTVSLPILQKDFVIDEYQIHEAASAGSDAILLIARLVDTATLQHFVTTAKALHLEPVVEVNDAEDLQKALGTDTKIIAVNSRDLRSFAIDVEAACKLMRTIPYTFIKLGFSGVHSSAEVKQFKQAGASAVLVGTSLMRAKDIGKFILSLRAE